MKLFRIKARFNVESEGATFTRRNEYHVGVVSMNKNPIVVKGSPTLISEAIFHTEEEIPRAVELIERENFYDVEVIAVNKKKRKDYEKINRK